MFGPSLVSVLHFLLHGVRRVLSLFARSLHVLPETVNRVASKICAQQDQHEYCEYYSAHSVSPLCGISFLTLRIQSTSCAKPRSEGKPVFPWAY